mmetsp:Transcript_46975/g.147195  ORF Transcript_46975/g.147195 Transcript_46975/m.147195 type:complete len:242 (+) Transcript_46975:238-963(+)
MTHKTNVRRSQSGKGRLWYTCRIGLKQQSDVSSLAMSSCRQAALSCIKSICPLAGFRFFCSLLCLFRMLLIPWYALIQQVLQLDALENYQLGSQDFLVLVQTIADRADVSASVDVYEDFVKLPPHLLLHAKDCWHVERIHNLELHVSRLTEPLACDVDLCLRLVDAHGEVALLSYDGCSRSAAASNFQHHVCLLHVLLCCLPILHYIPRYDDGALLFVHALLEGGYGSSSHGECGFEADRS